MFPKLRNSKFDMKTKKYISYGLGVVRRIMYKLQTRYCISRIRNYDYDRLIRHSGALHQNQFEQKRAALSMAYHVIEKGLTMPNKRLGFGQPSVLNLIRLCKEFSDEYSSTDAVFLHAIAVLKGYLKWHCDNNYVLEEKLETKIVDLINPYAEVLHDSQLRMSKRKFFSSTECPFPLFAASRHTCRHFAGAFPLKES